MTSGGNYLNTHGPGAKAAGALSPGSLQEPNSQPTTIASSGSYWALRLVMRRYLGSVDSVSTASFAVNDDLVLQPESPKNGYDFVIYMVNLGQAAVQHGGISTAIAESEKA